MHPFRIGVLACCLAALGCDSSSPPGATAPTPIPPPMDASTLEGRWEGTFLLDRTDPPGCPVVGLPGPSCPATPIRMELSLTVAGERVMGDLTSAFYGNPAESFPLTGLLATASSLTLTGERLDTDASCLHTTLRRMVSFTLRRSTSKLLEGEFHFDGDRRSSSCFFFDVQVYGRDVRLMHVSP